MKGHGPRGISCLWVLGIKKQLNKEIEVSALHRGQGKFNLILDTKAFTVGRGRNISPVQKGSTWERISQPQNTLAEEAKVVGISACETTRILDVECFCFTFSCST